MTLTSCPPTADDVTTAAQLISPYLQETPILTSSCLNDLVGCNILFKAEHLQKTGSFKARGALVNALRRKEEGANCVVTHSSGNHGQAVAWAARSCALPAIVVVPDAAPAAKTSAIEGYGAQLVRCDNTIVAREEECSKQAEERGAAIIEPYDARDTIVGQGTVGVELARQSNVLLDAIFVAAGGGGLAAGIALALPQVPLFLVEPEGKELRRQLDGNHDGNRDALDTLAVEDGIRVRALGKNNLSVLQAHKELHVITVSEEEIREALILIWTRLKQRVEPTAAVAFAGLRQVMTARSHPNLQNVAVILCGGNVDHSFTP